MSSLPLSIFASSLQPSPTRLFDIKAREMQKTGKNVLFFTLGEPDFATPKNVKRAAIAAIKENFSHYTPVAGIPELKQAIADKFKRDNNLDYSKEQVIVNVGAVNSLFLAFHALLNAGDEVLIPIPSWPTVFMQVKSAGAVPIFVQCKEENNFEVQFEDIAASITPKTKLIVLNSPCNPTGAVIPEKTVKKICDLAREKNLCIVSDEIYEKINYSAKATSPAKFYENVITLNGVSKAFAMTGWRIGFAAGPKHVIDAMAAIQILATSNPTSISQKAALEALNGSQLSIKKMTREFRQRRDLIVKLLSEIPGVKVNSPRGAFYVFPNVSGLFGKKTFDGKTLASSMDVADYFLNEALVATVPGKPFGSDSHIRFSYACSQEQIVEGMQRLKTCVDKLK